MATEVPSRRSVLLGVAAASVSPAQTWADTGSPSYLSAARMPDGSFRLFGLNTRAEPVFSIPLPARGHAAAAHPSRSEAIAFARRPGTYALVIDCATGKISHAFHAPADRHFYGHGVFSQDGSTLFTTENAYQEGEGRIGLWAADDEYRRLGEMPSGGIGPHDIKRLPGTEILVVANGGIDTHPDTGRAKLNLPTMRSNLSYISPEGGVVDMAVLPSEFRFNSIRHLDVRPDGLVTFGCQWQGDLAATPALVGVHRAGSNPRLLMGPRRSPEQMRGYIGSVAFSDDGARIAATAPRGNRAIILSSDDSADPEMISAEDVGGIAPYLSGFMVTSGTGKAGDLRMIGELQTAPLAWDNHLVGIPTGQG